MTYGSVCSGIEAASVAWGPLGWRCAFVSEIDPFASAVLEHHWPDVPNHGDFTTITEDSNGAAGIDLLVGGTPCQSFSVAGLRGGLDDDRGNLALEYCRLAQRLRPTWLVWENVPGVLSSNEGRDFGAFLGALVELGYGFAYRVLDAQYFGVAQRRRRVFVVAHAGGQWQRAAAVLFERASLSGDPAPCREEGAAVAGPVAQGSPGRGHRDDLETSGAFVPVGTQKSDRPLAHTLSARNDRNDLESETFVVSGTLQAAGRAAGSVTAQDAIAGAGVVPVDLAQITSASNRSNPAPGDPAYTLASTGSPVVAINANARQDPVHSPHSTPPLDTDGTTIAVGVRRLMPVEWERLQGFPDGHTAIEYRGKPAKDGPRYRAIGNSMAVPVMRWIGERIQRIEEIGR